MTDYAYSVTAYGVLTAAAVAAAMILTYVLVKFILRRDAGDIWRVFAIIIPIGLLGARAVYCAANPDGWQGVLNALSVWKGGLSLVGALLFAGIALRVLAGSNRAFKTACEYLTPGTMLFISIVRLAEPTAGEGVGKCVDTEFLRSGLFVMFDEYGDARHAVYRWEALAAILLCALALWLIYRSPKRPRAAGTVWTLFFAIQVLLESLRDDDYLKWEYVRISQAAYFLALLTLAGIYLTAAYKLKADKRGWFILLAIVLAGATITVIQEFRVDTDVNLELNYLIMALALAAVAAPTVYCKNLSDRRRKPRRKGTK